MKSICMYVREKKSGKRLGIVVAVGKDKVGWSKCAENDTFDKNVGISIALTGLEHPDLFPNRKTPPEFKFFINKMRDRSNKAKIFN